MLFRLSTDQTLLISMRTSRSIWPRKRHRRLPKPSSSVGSKAEVQIVAGDTSKAVCAAARDWKADLMVISRGVASEFLGRLRSRSYSIIRESPCPVVSV